jgi:type IV pilus assembly protein PilQ
MSKKAIYILLFLLSLSLIGCATAGGVKGQAVAQEQVITGIEVTDNAVEVKLSGVSVPSYTIYKPMDPYIVVVDLPGIGVGSAEGKIVSDKAGISEVRVMKVDTPVSGTKIEILLDSPSNIEPQFTDGSLILAVKKGIEEDVLPVVEEAEEVEELEAVEQEVEVAEEAEAEEATKISDVRFDYSDGTVKLIIEGDGLFSPNVFTLKDRIVIDVPDVSMEASLPDTVIYPVKALRYGMHEGKVRLVVDLKEEVEFSASAEADSIVIAFSVEEEQVVAEIAEAEVAEEEVPEPVSKYKGKKISLDFQDADIVPIFRFLGEVSGYNVVIHPQVKGRITLKLMNVPWDQALEIILQTFNLGMSIEGNILTIAPASVFAKWQQEEVRLKEARMKAAELVQEDIPINYADASDILNSIKSAKLLSPRGSITLLKWKNTLSINDTAENIAKIKERIKGWDTPPKQVLIEAKIVEVNSDYTSTLGIRWGGTFTGRQEGTPISGDFSVNTPVTSFGATAGSEAARKTGIGMTIGSGNTVQVALSLEALETVGKSRKLANPRVLTMDNQPAEIVQGKSIPVQTTTAEGTKTEFVDANLNLKVTPQITPDGYIKLKIDAAKDSPVVLEGGETGIDKKSIRTQALVKDGETLVLGGIYTSEDSKSDTGIPLLSRIPILGWLFKTRTVQKPQTELLILITPKIVERAEETF